MSGAFYAMFVVAILFVVLWYIRNERDDLGGADGLLAMRSEDVRNSPPPEPVANSQFRRTKESPSAFRVR
jgi:hypothetical protein